MLAEESEKLYNMIAKDLLNEILGGYIDSTSTSLVTCILTFLGENFPPNYAIGVLIYTVEYKVAHNLYFCQFRR
jgi:hypothetical protein